MVGRCGTGTLNPAYAFVQYELALSRKYGTETAALRIFDRYLREHAVADFP
jgi:hypothetical protein